MRHSTNEYKNSRLWNGYDYDRQAWVVDGKYVRCGHPEDMDCKCYGRRYEGTESPIETEKTIRDFSTRR